MQMEQDGREVLDRLPRPDYRDEEIAIFNDLTNVPAYRDSVCFNVFALLLCTEGSMDVEINGRRHAVVKGQCLIGRPNDKIARCRQSADFRGKFFMIAPEMIAECISENERWTREFRLKENPNVAIPHDKLHVYELYSDILLSKTTIAGSRDPYARRSLVSIVRAALFELISDMGEPDTDHARKLMRQPEMLYKRFVELLESKSVKPRDVGWYADHLCVTPKYLSAVCKSACGLTAFELIRRAALNDIRHALKYGNRSIKEMACELGFSNTSFFGKYVKAAFGMSPRALRKRLRDENEVFF